MKHKKRAEALCQTPVQTRNETAPAIHPPE